MANTIVGKILAIGQTVNVSKKDKAFYKRELLLNASRFDPYTGEEHKNVLTLAFAQNNCQKLDGFRVGDLVEVSFVLQGREFEKDGQTRYITDAVAYGIAYYQNGQQQSHGAQAPAPQPQAPAPSPAPQPQQAPQFPSAQQAQAYAQQVAQQGQQPQVPF